MSETIAIAWFVSLFVLAVIGMGLIAWIFHRLRNNHSATYEALGSPSLFWNNSLRNNWLFFKFLFRGQWRDLNDPRLAAVARATQVLFVVYMVGFLGLVIIFLTVGIKPG
jgi:hypothetical protein